VPNPAAAYSSLSIRSRIFTLASDAEAEQFLAALRELRDQALCAGCHHAGRLLPAAHGQLALAPL
jgi:hypothetical protein